MNKFLTVTALASVLALPVETQRQRVRLGHLRTLRQPLCQARGVPARRFVRGSTIKGEVPAKVHECKSFVQVQVCFGFLPAQTFGRKVADAARVNAAAAKGFYKRDAVTQ